jgi:hypothetical protein
LRYDEFGFRKKKEKLTAENAEDAEKSRRVNEFVFFLGALCVLRGEFSSS